MQQEFQKTLAETVSTTPGAEPEPEPAQVQVLNPVDLSPQVLRMHRQHATDYMKLMMESGINLSMGEDRAAPLITEVCSSMPTS